MKSFYSIAITGALLVSWKIKSSEGTSDALFKQHLRQRGLVVETSSFDYSASPSPQATSKCALINVVVNETATASDEHIWLVDTNIPNRIRRFYNNDGYDTVFVCGNGVGESVVEPTPHRFMGCSVADASGALVNPFVVNWRSNDPDNSTVTDHITSRIQYALEESMEKLPSSIEGINLLDTCQQFDKRLVFVTDEFEEIINYALKSNGLKTDIQNKGYVLDAISHWTTGSHVGTYIYSVS